MDNFDRIRIFVIMIAIAGFSCWWGYRLGKQMQKDFGFCTVESIEMEGNK